MILAERIAQNLTSLGFVLLGVATALEWYRHRGHAQAMLALSLIFLAVVSALGRLSDVLGPAWSAGIGIVNIVAFMASAYFVLAGVHDRTCCTGVRAVLLDRPALELRLDAEPKRQMRGK